MSEAAESDALLGHHVVLDTHQLVNGKLIQFTRLGAHDFALRFQDTSVLGERDGACSQITPLRLSTLGRRRVLSHVGNYIEHETENSSSWHSKRSTLPKKHPPEESTFIPEHRPVTVIENRKVHGRLS